MENGTMPSLLAECELVQVILAWALSAVPSRERKRPVFDLKNRSLTLSARKENRASATGVSAQRCVQSHRKRPRFRLVLGFAGRSQDGLQGTGDPNRQQPLRRRLRVAAQKTLLTERPRPVVAGAHQDVVVGGQ